MSPSNNEKRVFQGQQVSKSIDSWILVHAGEGNHSAFSTNFLLLQKDFLKFVTWWRYEIFDELMIQVRPVKLLLLWCWWWWWWWWWIVFVIWLINERRLALFSAWTIVRDPHHLEFLIFHWVQALLNEVV